MGCSSLSQRFIVFLVRSRELESLALWLKEQTGHISRFMEVALYRRFIVKHRNFWTYSLCIPCRILQRKSTCASCVTVQNPCRNRALTLEQTKIDPSDNDLTALVWVISTALCILSYCDRCTPYGNLSFHVIFSYMGRHGLFAQLVVW